MRFWLRGIIVRLFIWATRRLYAEFAWAYDLVAWAVSLGAWSRWRSLALDYAGSGRVLEVGFGTGALLLEMRRRGWQVTGLDASASMHRVTARRLRRKGLQANRVRALAQAPPFVSGSFGTIISTFPAEFILESQTLVECARLLRPRSAGDPAGGSRVVIVGLTVELLLRKKAPASSTFERFLTPFLPRILAAGLQPRLEYRRLGLARLPVLLLEPSG